MCLNDGLHAGNSLVRYAVCVLRLGREILAASLGNALLKACNACLRGGVALHTHDADGGNLIPALILCRLNSSLAAHGGQLLVVETDKAEHLVRVDGGINRHDRQVGICNLCCNGFRLKRRNYHCITVVRAERGFDHGKLLVICGFRARAQNVDRNAQIFTGLLAAVADILPVFGCERFQNDLDMVILLCGLVGSVTAVICLCGVAAAACESAHHQRAGYQCSE